MEKIENISEDEKTLLRRYLPQMETASKHNYYTAVPSTDMLQLQAIYKRHINPHHTPNAWCSHCCVATLKGLYEFAKRTIYGNDKTSED